MSCGSKFLVGMSLAFRAREIGTGHICMLLTSGICPALSGTIANSARETINGKLGPGTLAFFGLWGFARHYPALLPIAPGKQQMGSWDLANLHFLDLADFPSVACVAVLFCSFSASRSVMLKRRWF